MIRITSSTQWTFQGQPRVWVHVHRCRNAHTTTQYQYTAIRLCNKTYSSFRCKSSGRWGRIRWSKISVFVHFYLGCTGSAHLAYVLNWDTRQMLLPALVLEIIESWVMKSENHCCFFSPANSNSKIPWLWANHINYCVAGCKNSPSTPIIWGSGGPVDSSKSFELIPINLCRGVECGHVNSPLHLWFIG